jgi:acyl-coenzyme A synthetase/AMP-(fatty) acid ligase
VLACEDASGNKRLMAYWVASDGQKTAAAKELREFLSGRLPDYMLPSGFVHLETMPLTPSGKVDRLSLAAHSPSPLHEPGEATQSPRTQLESELKEIWEGVLGISPIGVALVPHT